MTRAYSFLEIKALDDEQRILEGWASRVEPDRVSDVVEPKGAVFRLPLPLLMDHNHTAAVGDVFEAKVSDVGIRFKAKIAKIAEGGALKDLCDSAWSAAKAGLRRAVSIGFRPLDAEPLPNGGTRFKRWDWYELSMVSVPCAPGATIDSIKSFDRDLIRRANKGRVVRLDKPRAHRVVKLDMAATAGTKPGGVMRAAEAAMDEIFEAQRLAALAKKVGPEALPIRMISEAARETDLELAELRARLAKLEARR